jgi:hypothetical protein
VVVVDSKAAKQIHQLMRLLGMHFNQAAAELGAEPLALMWQQIINTPRLEQAVAVADLVTVGYLVLHQTVEVVWLLFVGHNV